MAQSFWVRVLGRSVVLACIFVLQSCAAHPAARPTIAPAETYPEIATAVDTLSTAGFQGAILVEAGDGPVRIFTNGSARCDGGDPLSGAERFDMGSITKQVTAAAILRLVEQRRLTLETRLGDVLQGVPEDKAGITVNQLLRHTSGLPDSLGEDETYVSKAGFLALAYAAPRETLAEGDDLYSNVGYSLLAAEIEQLTGRRYEDAVRELVLIPAGVPGIHYVAGPARQNACGLRDGQRWGSTRDYFSRTEPSWFLVGNGGLLATPTELASLFGAIWNGRVLSAESRSLFDAVLRRTDRGGRPVRVTSGSNLIFTSLYFNWPDQRTTIVIMTSDSRFPKERVTPILYPAIVTLFERLAPARAAP